MLEIKNLSKSYGDYQALDSVSFRAGKGVTGFLGPNGAGKTTTMRIITGSLLADSGEVYLGDHELTSEDLQSKARIGYLPESNALYKNMRVDEFLLFIAELKGVTDKSSIQEVATECGLKDVLTKEIETLSKGYRQRVGLAKALLGNPEYLILDEPTTGLDPNQKQDILKLIQKLARNKVVLFSSHVLSEVQAIASQLVIISAGKIVAQGKLDVLLKQNHKGSTLRVRTDAAEVEFSKLAGKLSNVTAVSAKATKGKQEFREFSLQVTDSVEAAKEVFALCVKKKWVIVEMVAEKEDLDELFRQLTK
jgi:ABC-2 type transport system ATP-binding protein